MRTNIFTLALAATCALVIAGCKKDKNEEPLPTTGTLKLSWGFHWGEPDFMLDSTYTDDFGHAIAIHDLRYIISDIRFTHGTSLLGDFHNRQVIFDAAEADGYVTLGDLSPATFDSLHVTLGLDSALNHGDPNTAGEPLNDTTMHWGPGTTNGYYFLVIVGQVDDDGDGVVDAGDPTFTYKCATDGMRRGLTAAAPYSVSAGNVTTPHMHVHVNELLAGIDVLNNLTAIGAQPVDQQLMDQLVSVIELE